MDDILAGRLAEFLAAARKLENSEGLGALADMYADLFAESGSEPQERLKSEVRAAAAELAESAEDRRRKALSESEKSESVKVCELLDGNLFTYHFQPIIRADSGMVYAYEALMRAGNMQGITPFHILKYAAMTDRLKEVEAFTFLNVLHFISENKDKLGGRPVFINSMPNIRLDEDTEKEVERLLIENSDQVVVEMTENYEYADSEAARIKEKYHRLNIPIAIDDFGSGYSNITNLLHYTPNVVKIDRSLISGIESDQNKKHFVREIVDFCAENKIMTLAEGVETQAELQTVVRLGIDLIQGFYTARPSPELITSIPYELRNEIRVCHDEREDGRRLRLHYAENGERLSLEKLARSGISRIIVGRGFSVGTVTVSGMPFIDTDIHIETAEGYCGRIVLEYAHLSNLTEKPCIDIGENSKPVITLVGESKLKNSGIRVPESSTVTLEGKGSLSIELGSADYYGIGNDLYSRHGELIFEQDGTVNITAESHSGVCIGSGLGGKISIRRGRYVLRASGGMSLCIGAYSGSAEIEMIGCDLYAYAAGALSASIGSVSGDAKIRIMYSNIKCSTEGQMSAAIGTVQGESSEIVTESASFTISMTANTLTSVGSLFGSSDISIRKCGFKINADGAYALAFGGINGQTKLFLTDVDLSAEIATEFKVCAAAVPEDIEIVGGKCSIKMGDTVLDTLPVADSLDMPMGPYVL